MPRKVPSIPDTPPHAIDPYDILSLPATASASEIKTAYKRLALLHHPDKAPPSQRDQAHTDFQNLAFAYAILSDERRRNRYDATGNTSESLDIDDSDFDWTSFFRTQYADVVTGAKLDDFKSEYQNSEEETRDVLTAYRSHKGKMNAIYSRVMMSNPLEDEDRFRAIIDGAIAKGEVEAYAAYTNESAKSRGARMKNARREGVEAQAYAKKLGVHDKLFDTGPKKSKKGGSAAGEADLAALIQQRGQGRTESFLDNLEKKYSKDTRGKKRAAAEEPSEEAFERMAKRGKKRKEVEAVEAVEVDDEGEEVVNLSEEEEEEEEQEEGEEEEEEEEEEAPKQKPRRTRQTKKARDRPKRARAQGRHN
ncbi:MAG: hypothetical protein Q9187_003857 [Circinaria calcarea]